MSNFAINPLFNNIPFNAQENPYTSYVCGEGTNRPIGFTYNQIVKLRWTVRSFNLSVVATDISGGIGGEGSLLVSSKTDHYQLKYTLPQKNDNSGKIDRLTSLSNINFADSGGQSVAAGTKMSVNQSNVSLDIDFSSIIYSKNLYYPIITITLKNAITNTQLSSVSSPLGTFRSLGGIAMEGGLIYLYSNVYFAVQGNVFIKNDCCNRHFFDGQDKARIEDGSCEDCKKLLGNS